MATGAQVLVQELARQQVDLIFGVPGGAVLPLYDALYDAPIRHVLVRHEQGAALAADGYARVSGRVGVCVATSGPGATNLVTGLATSYMDSIPVVAVTGNVPRAVTGTDAFQEADIFGVSMPVTKHNYIIREPEDLVPVIREAFALAAAGRPGPVLIDVPRDILAGEMSDQVDERASRRWQANLSAAIGDTGDPAKLKAEAEAAARAVAKARRPVLYAGGGVVHAGAAGALRAIAQRYEIPVTTTLMALGTFPGDDPLFMGMPGMHGTYAANMALTQTDCLIAVGARFDDRVTGRPGSFASEATIIHIDIDASEHGKIKLAQVPIVANARDGLEALSEALAEHMEGPVSADWLNQIDVWKRDHPYRYDRDRPELMPQAVIEALSRAAGPEAYVVTGVGQHQMWAAMFYTYQRPRQFLTSGGLGTMGYALPAAIGAQLAAPEAPIIVIDGDGSFQMNSQELATLAELGLPVKLFIINNACHGMVRQWQQLFFQKRLSSSIFQGNPDFVRLAEAYGIRGLRIDKPQDLAAGVREALAYPGPILIDCVVRQEENVLPMVPPGAALKEMIEA